jgi:hypothetical protein
MAIENENVVSAKHRGYDDFYKRRMIYQDVIAGTLRLRKKGTDSKSGEGYLPKFPKETQKSYEFRRDTATCFNLTKKTRDVMVGLVCQSEIEIGTDVSSEIKSLMENINNEGDHLDVFARKAFEATFEGYSAILVDAPATQARDMEQERLSGLRPYWVLYTADQIWNWRYRINAISKKKELELIVLREDADEPDGEYLSKNVTRYRKFKLVDNLVVWELWREVEVDGLGQKKVIKEDGGTLERLTQIPVGVLGSIGMAPPLLDIALKNVEHFQTYSDYKSIIHKTCVPILVKKGASTGETVPIGGDIMLTVPVEGDVKFAEPSGSSIESVRLSLVDMQEAIALQGLSLLADKTARVDLTATEALLNNIGETAELRVMARNLQDTIELCSGHTAEYLGKPRVGGGSYVLGTAWNKAEKEAEEQRAVQLGEAAGSSAGGFAN